MAAVSLDDGSRIDDTPIDRIRRDLDVPSEGVNTFYIEVTEQQALDIASGYVPNAIKAAVRTMLDWQEEDRRRAERPVPSKRKATRNLDTPPPTA